MGYIISLGVGFGVGLLYWLLKVQSPAPPLIALAGLLGMVLGEHAIPVVKAQFFAQSAAVEAASPSSALPVPAPMPDGSTQKAGAPGASKQGG
ncbi:DUF1427 family protein [Paraburkholderia kirstenboschensis]|uniref:DUF1427 family protein n=1 Tax=Paraburkholderia kirstenboschensis TaxID=1245436 RepID=A0ABZ0ETM7_9BURK|nr:DUF1427 family protein [Paraburkholderia kirstenboschensis]WOD20135.1 DUF1427 family protein [Paraburkholderia kirstenboschensis]